MENFREIAKKISRSVIITQKILVLAALPLLLLTRPAFAEDPIPLDFVNVGTVESDGNNTNEVVASMQFVSNTQTKFKWQFQGTGTSGFTGIFHSFDKFSTTSTAETKNLTSYSKFVIGITAPQGTRTKFEVKDGAGKTGFITLPSPAGGGEAIFSIPFTIPFFAVLDFSKIKEVNTIITAAQNPGTAQKEMIVNFGYYPVVLPNPALGISDVTSLGPYVTGGFHAEGATETITFLSPKSIQQTYNLNNQIAGVFHVFDNPATDDKDPMTTDDIETIDLQTAAGGTLVMGVQAPSGTTVKVEATDKNGVARLIYLVGQNGAKKFYSIPNAMFEDVDKTQIKSLNILLDGKYPAQPQTGTMELDFGTYPFTPMISPDSGLNLFDVTWIDPTYSYGSFKAGAVNVGLLIDTNFTAIFTFDFTPPGGGPKTLTKSAMAGTLTQPLRVTKINEPAPILPFSSYAGIYHSYDNPMTTESVETLNLQTVGSGSGTLVIGIEAPANTTVKVQVKDITGKTDSVYLIDTDGTEKFYAMPSTLFDGIDVTKVTGIDLVLEKDLPPQPLPPQTEEGIMIAEFGLYL